MKMPPTSRRSGRSVLHTGYTMLALLLLQQVAPLLALAGTPINETRSVSPQGRIEIANVRGSVNVSVWDRSEVSVTGTLGEGSKGLSIEGGGDHLEIRVKPPGKQGWFSWGAGNGMQDSLLDVRVPKGSSLDIEVVSATVDVAGIEGRELSIDNVSGKVRLDSRARELSVDSVSGSIEMTGSADEAKFESVSGNVRVRASGGEFKFETVSGDVDAELQGYREMTGGTVSGGVRLRGTPAARARIEIETMSGDVRVELPADLAASLRAETFSGRLRSDFGSIKTPEHGPGRSLDTVLGNGDGRISLETFSGDIEIRKQP